MLYRNMVSASADLDWEVKLQALDFWKAVIDESLAQQGMLDGMFPEMIFSAEKQKIIKCVCTNKSVNKPLSKSFLLKTTSQAGLGRNSIQVTESPGPLRLKWLPQYVAPARGRL